MANYEKARVQLIKTQISKLKSTAKSTTGTTLRKTNKNFQYEEFAIHATCITSNNKTKS